MDLAKIALFEELRAEGIRMLDPNPHLVEDRAIKSKKTYLTPRRTILFAGEMDAYTV